MKIEAFKTSRNILTVKLAVAVQCQATFDIKNFGGGLGEFDKLENVILLIAFRIMKRHKV